MIEVMHFEAEFLRFDRLLLPSSGIGNAALISGPFPKDKTLCSTT
jgi:hypothetical protein